MWLSSAKGTEEKGNVVTSFLFFFSLPTSFFLLLFLSSQYLQEVNGGQNSNWTIVFINHKNSLAKNGDQIKDKRRRKA